MTYFAAAFAIGSSWFHGQTTTIVPTLPSAANNRSVESSFGSEDGLVIRLKYHGPKGLASRILRGALGSAWPIATCCRLSHRGGSRSGESAMCSTIGMESSLPRSTTPCSGTAWKSSARPSAPRIARAFVERFIGSLRSECLNHFLFFGLKHLDSVAASFLEHYLGERPHQGKDNELLSERPKKRSGQSPPDQSTDSGIVSLRDVRSEQWLGGLLKHYSRKAA